MQRDNRATLFPINIRLISRLLIALTLIAAVTLLFPAHFVVGLDSYLPLHTAMEAISVLAAMLVFVVGVNSYREKTAANLVLLSSAFLAVGLLDFAHTLSYAGMPDLVTASGPEKAIYFWLAARTIAALALLGAALPWQNELGKRPQAAFLAGALAVSAIICWAVLYHQPDLPRVLDAVAGLTPFKRAMEYLIVGVNAVTALIFLRRRQMSHSYDIDLMFAAVVTMGLGELFFAAYSNISDTLNLLGHAYKIAAYYLLYRAIFAHAIRTPYRQLIESERHLRESEERYRLLLETAAEGIWLIDQRYTTVFANQKMAEMLGYAGAAQMIGHSMFHFIDEQDQNAATNDLERRRQGTSAQHEFKFRRCDGSEFWANLSTSPVFQDGEYIGALTMVADITERRLATQKIAALQDRNELILNNIGDGICGLDADGLIQFINPAAARMLGYRVEELLGRPLHAVSHHSRANGSAYPAEECPILGALKHGYPSYENGELFWRRDGSSFPAEYSCTPVFESNDENIRVVVVFSDITERKRAADLIADLYNNAPNGYHSLDPQGMIVHINDTELAWLGYRREEMVGKMSIQQILSESSMQAFREYYPLFKKSGHIANLDFEMVRKDGSTLPVLVTATAVKDEEGRYLMSRSVVLDMTERRQAEKMLRESENRYRTLFGSIQDAIFVFPIGTDGVPGKFIEVNEVTCRMLGYSREELLGMTVADVDDRDAGVDPTPLIKRLLAGESIVFEQMHATKEGRRISVEVNANPFKLAGQSVVMALVRDITERKRMAQETSEAHQRLRQLSAHLQTVREEEKASIAREIHDDLGGTLTALKMDAYWLARKLPADQEAAPLRERIESMSQLLDNAVSVTRRIITELRPSVLDDLGLLAALEWQAAQFHKRTDIDCRVNCIEDKGQLDQQHAIALFRIFQEALTNVTRHSGASRVDVQFQHGDKAVSLLVHDNGRGLGENVDMTNRYGIRGMFERASALGGFARIESPPGGGLTVNVIFPLKNPTIEETP